MISSREEYLYFTPPPSVAISGAVMPLRSGTPTERILLGEDVSFLAEALAERAVPRTGSMSGTWIPSGAYGQTPAISRWALNDVRKGMAYLEQLNWVKGDYEFAGRRGIDGDISYLDEYAAAFIGSSDWSLPSEIHADLSLASDTLAGFFSDFGLMTRSMAVSGGISYTAGTIVYDTWQEGVDPKHTVEAIGDETGFISAYWQDPHYWRHYGQIVRAGHGEKDGAYQFSFNAVTAPGSSTYYFLIPGEAGLKFNPAGIIPILRFTTTIWRDYNVTATKTDFVIPDFNLAERAFGLPAGLLEEVADSHMADVDKSGLRWCLTSSATIMFVVDWGFPATVDV